MVYPWFVRVKETPYIKRLDVFWAHVEQCNKCLLAFDIFKNTKDYCNTGYKLHCQVVYGEPKD